MLLTEEREARERLRAAYRERHYLTTKVGDADVVEEAGVVRITVPIQEGPRAVVGAVTFPGATLPAEELQRLAAIEIGAPYDRLAATDAIRRLREHYLGLGYPAVGGPPPHRPRAPRPDGAGPHHQRPSTRTSSCSSASPKGGAS